MTTHSLRARLVVPALALAATLLALPATAAVLVIDDFSTDQGPLTVSPLVPPQSDSSSASGAGIIGGSRDMVLSTDPGTSGVSSFATVTGGIAQLADNSQFQSDLLFQWDGGDNDPNALDHTGLGGVDLTSDNNTAFEIGLLFDDLPATLSMTVWSIDGNSSSLAFPATGLIFTNLSIFIPYALFSGSADFTNVGAIELAITSPTNGLDIALDYIQTGIEPVPVPAAFWLFASALLGLRLTRRRR